VSVGGGRDGDASLGCSAAEGYAAPHRQRRASWLLATTVDRVPAPLAFRQRVASFVFQVDQELVGGQENADAIFPVYCGKTAKHIVILRCGDKCRLLGFSVFDNEDEPVGNKAGFHCIFAPCTLVFLQQLSAKFRQGFSHLGR